MLNDTTFINLWTEPQSNFIESPIIDDYQSITRIIGEELEGINCFYQPMVHRDQYK